jgi:hypothetical protein
VYLKPVDGSEPPEKILAFAEGSIVPPSLPALKMEWLTPIHLELTYAGGRYVAYQAAECFGIKITARKFFTIDFGPSGRRRNEEIGHALENKK